MTVMVMATVTAAVAGAAEGWQGGSCDAANAGAGAGAGAVAGTAAGAGAGAGCFCCCRCGGWAHGGGGGAGGGGHGGGRWRRWRASWMWRLPSGGFGWLHVIINVMMAKRVCDDEPAGFRAKAVSI